jgi:hypothetical protein
MNETDTYEIRVQGHLDRRWSAWFDGMTLVFSADGSTLMRGRVPDQAALHGLIQKVRDLGLPLLSVTQTPTVDPQTGHNQTDHSPTGPTS